MAKNTMANRCGLDLKIYAYTADGVIENEETPLAVINFANEVSIELTSDMVWATGGQEHNKIVGFNNPIEGTLKISTQMVNMELLTLISGGDVSAASTKVSFKNSKAVPKFYIIKGETVWVGEDGKSYAETITAFKACAKRNYNVTYNGDGDPQSLDVEFELGANAKNAVMDIDREVEGGA